MLDIRKIALRVYPNILSVSYEAKFRATRLKLISPGGFGIEKLVNDDELDISLEPAKVLQDVVLHLHTELNNRIIQERDKEEEQLCLFLK